MRVLLVAEQCNPEMVSVPLVGWSHSQALAKVTDAHLVTQVRNRDAIRRAGLREGKDFTAIDTEAIEARVFRLASRLRGGTGKAWTLLTAMTSLSYPYFEHLVWKRFGRQIRARKFDVVHRLTPLSPAMPSLLAGRCREAGVPFVIGPLNGGVPWPPGFRGVQRREREWLSAARELHRLVPGYGATRRHASAILIASRITWEQVPETYRRKCIYLPENAVDPARFTRRRMRRATLPVRAIFVGRLVPLKAMDLFLEAAAPLVRAGKLTVDILGDGPEMIPLKRIVAGQGLEAGVSLPGWVEHAKLQDRLADADVLAFPSIREFGGGAVLEAMAVGLPPIVMDYAGPAELVTDRTGWLIPMGTREQIVERLGALLVELTNHPEQIDEKSPAAIERVMRNFTWDVKAQQVVAVYRWVLDTRQPKPSFGMPLPDAPPGR